MTGSTLSPPLILRGLRRDETDFAADLHRRAGALIPGYDPGRHPPAAFAAPYRERVFAAGPLRGAFDGGRLVGHLALLPGWIDHVYVEPGRHSEGIGGALVRLAQREQADLRLHTLANARARRLYERHGFVAEAFGDGSGNEEGMPDGRYRWRRADGTTT